MAKITITQRQDTTTDYDYGCVWIDQDDVLYIQLHGGDLVDLHSGSVVSKDWLSQFKPKIFKGVFEVTQ